MLKQLFIVIKANWRDKPKRDTQILSDLFAECMSSRKLTLNLSSEYPLVRTYVEQLLSDWKAINEINQHTTLNIYISSQEIKRFGQIGIKLEADIALIEVGQKIISEKVSMTGYSPKNVEKAYVSAQQKLVKAIELKLKHKLRNYYEI
ncbi:hypothetical protein ACMZOO_16185 [Catenovulum sp. SX2]|uniref:hypothetical protein n=1 Tax=Catenovulum sp. SX2 TaxID=3398614 RepID=UPI003F840086